MTLLVQLVDTKEYVESNCFQHQLLHTLKSVCLEEGYTFMQCELKEILRGGTCPKEAGVISCLKQRSIFNNIDGIARWLDTTPVVIYDQDPWQSYMDDSPYKGAYDLMFKKLNVKTFALTTQWWVDFLKERGLPSSFAKMGVLPEYCSEGVPYVDRKAVAGFVGTVHSRRQELLDVIERSGIKTSVLRSNSLSYEKFLRLIACMRIFVHNETMPILVDGKELDFGTGMWVKDIEAVSQGCFSIRGKGEGSETYLQNVQTVFLYDTLDQVPEIIRHIEALEPEARQNMINHDVSYVRSANVWKKTAQQLVALSAR